MMNSICTTKEAAMFVSWTRTLSIDPVPNVVGGSKKFNTRVGLATYVQTANYDCQSLQVLIMNNRN